jgi:hypothetical protein
MTSREALHTLDSSFECCVEEPAMPVTIAVGSRSLFVTSVAWLFILLGVMASGWALLQNAMLVSLLPPASAVGLVPALPADSMLVSYMPWVVNTGFVMSIATLVSAIGLLRRLNWARRSFIGLLAVAIVANLLGLWLQQEMMQTVVSSMLGNVALPSHVFGGFVTAGRVMAVVMTLGACALLAGMIRGLMTDRVRQEFA